LNEKLLLFFFELINGESVVTVLIYEVLFRIIQNTWPYSDKETSYSQAVHDEAENYVARWNSFSIVYDRVTEKHNRENHIECRH